MDNAQKLNRRFEAIGWGAFFIWWGVTELLPSLPDGVGTLGIGLILLGLNAARSLNSVPISGFITALGVLALLLGGAELVGPILNLPFELPIFEMFLIAIGMIIIVRALSGSRNQ